MNKILKVFLINTILVMSMLIYSQNNISYCQSYDTLEELIKTQEKVNYLEGKITDLDSVLDNSNESSGNNIELAYNSLEKNIGVNINNLKYLQVNTIKSFYESQLIDCENYKNELVNEITEERTQLAENNNISYIKGQWPVKGYTYISSSYGYRVHPISKKLSFHTGIDIPAPKNTNVLASDDGIVIYSGYTKGYGNLVKIKHFDGKVTVYAHNNIMVVNKGDIVKKGQVISKVGSTGNSTGDHVHFEIIVDDKRINPLDGVTKDM